MNKDEDSKSRNATDVPPRRRRWLTRGLLARGARRAGGAMFRLANTLLAWTLLLALAGQLFLWVALRNDWRLRLPEFASRFVFKRLDEKGIEVRCPDIYVRPTGALEAENVDMRARGGDSPNFTVRHIAASVSLPSLFQGKFVLKRAVLDGGVFYCPPSASPDGVRRVVLEDARALLEQEPDGWLRVRTVQARYGAMPIVLNGEFLPFVKKRKEMPKPPSLTPDKWHAINFLAIQLLDARPKFESLGRVSLEVDGAREEDGGEHGSVLFHIAVKGEDFLLPGIDNARARGVRLSGASRFDGSKFQPAGHIVLAAREFEWELPLSGARHAAAAESANAATAVTAANSTSAARNTGGTPVPLSSAAATSTLRAGPVRFSATPGARWRVPTGMDFSACDVTFAGERLDYVNGALDWSAFPTGLAATLRATSGADILTVRAKGNPVLRTLDAAFAVRVAPARILARPDVRARLPERLASLAIHQPVELAGNVRFSSGFRFKDLNTTFATGAGDFADFRVQSARGRVHLTPAGIEVSDADVDAGGYRGRGGFRTGFGKGDEFRFLLHGSTHPDYLGRFLGKFWVELWEQFDIRHDSLPRADIEIRGNWGVQHEFIYCGAAGENLAFRGARFDKAHLRILETPDRISLHDMQAWQGERTATGTFQLHYIPPPVHRRESFRFYFEGDFPKETSARLGGPELHKLLAPVTSADPASPIRTTVTGYVHSHASPTPDRVQVRVTADAPGNTEAWGLRFHDFKGSVAYDTGLALITVDDAGFARGHIGGKSTATIGGAAAPAAAAVIPRRLQRAWLDLRPDEPTLHLDVELLGARRDSLAEAAQSLIQFTTKQNAANANAAVTATQSGAGGSPVSSPPVTTAAASDGLNRQNGLNGQNGQASAIPSTQTIPSIESPPHTGETPVPLPAAAATAPEAPGVPAASDAPPEAPGAPAAAPDNSSVDIRFVGGLTLPKLETLAATGTVHFWDPDLPNLHLFGGLSRILDKVGINASTFKIERATGAFTIRDSTVHLPEIKITGENAEITSAGSYDITADRLAFRARLTPRVAQGIPGLKQTMTVLYKWTEFVPVSITGHLAKPEWSLDLSLPGTPLAPKKSK